MDVTTRGEIAAFHHLLPEEAEGATLSAEEARPEPRLKRWHVGMAYMHIWLTASDQSPKPVEPPHARTWTA